MSRAIASRIHLTDFSEGTTWECFPEITRLITLATGYVHPFLVLQRTLPFIEEIMSVFVAGSSCRIGVDYSSSLSESAAAAPFVILP